MPGIFSGKVGKIQNSKLLSKRLRLFVYLFEIDRGKKGNHKGHCQGTGYHVFHRVQGPDQCTRDRTGEAEAGAGQGPGNGI